MRRWVRADGGENSLPQHSLEIPKGCTILEECDIRIVVCKMKNKIRGADAVNNEDSILEHPWTWSRCKTTSCKRGVSMVDEIYRNAIGWFASDHGVLDSGTEEDLQEARLGSNSLVSLVNLGSGCCSESAWGTWDMKPHLDQQSSGNATIRHDRDDQRSWKWDKSGQFSVNSATLGLAKLVPRLSVKGIWKNLVPTKLCFFAWLVWHNRINTVDNLQRRWITWTLQPSRCELCGQGGETMNHLFLECGFLV
ncbi:hypothetical protein Scep_014605 [Stephania cephalantha]|uniref:Reverse transcriptase zinc-binding domain-containing protein n=1 Tax=Stephania cephalantha TaxID=152367 RepID=A0AAP0J1J9_9MAGN